MTQVDIQEAQLKSRMIESAERVVALIDSTKFGKVDLTPFASVEQVSHILTDSDLDPRYIEELRQTCAILTVCGENTTSSYTPCSEEMPRYKIGFANLGESMPFPVDVRRGLEQAAQDASNVDLILADNQLSGEVALRVADRLIAEGVDLVIEYQIDEKAGGLIMDKFNRGGRARHRRGHSHGRCHLFWGRPLPRRTHGRRGPGELDCRTLGWHLRPSDRPGGTADRARWWRPASRASSTACRALSARSRLQRIIRLDSGNTSEISQANMMEALAEPAQ